MVDIEVYLYVASPGSDVIILP